MSNSCWDDKLLALQPLILKPIVFNNMRLTLIDAVIACHPSGWSVENHRHPWFEFNFISTGCLCTKLENTEFSSEQHSFFLIPPGVFHSNQNKSLQADDGFCLRFQLENNFASSNNYSEDNTYQQVNRVLSHLRPYSSNNVLINSFISSLNKKSDLITLQMAFTKFIMDLHELWNEKILVERNPCSRDEIIIQQALLFLSEYYPNHLSVNDVANSLNVSYRHLARIFKNITGVTIIEKLNDIRINSAKELLRDTDKTIYEIALSVGYENEYYFSNIFKKFTYSTPSEFRKKFRK